MARPSAEYEDYAKGLRALMEGDTLMGPKGRVVVLWGPSDYLIHKGLQALRDRVRKAGRVSVTSVDATELTVGGVGSMTQQRSLFEPSALYVVRRCEKAGQSFGKLLAKCEAPRSDKTRFMFGLCRDEMYKELGKVFDAWGAVMVPCFEPRAGALAGFVAALARRFQLSLRVDAVPLMLEAVGSDLFKLENEICRLALLFADNGGQEVGAAEITPHLGMLRSDTAFEIDNMLLRRRWSDAESLLYGILAREGDDEAIKILGLLSRHCRMSLGTAEMMAARASERDIASTLGLWGGAAKMYMRYATSGDPARFERALDRCRQADARFKSSRADAYLVMAEIIDELAGERSESIRDNRGGVS